MSMVARRTRPSAFPTPAARPGRATIALAFLAALVLARCSCDETQTFVPSALYTPTPALDFGLVSVSTQKTLPIKVLSNGGAGLRLSGLTFNGASADTLRHFIFEGQRCDGTNTCAPFKSELIEGLAPGRTSSITITFRPCPDAWNGDVLKEGADLTAALTACPTALVQVTMSILDNTSKGSTDIVLSGQPAQSPVMEVFCAGSGACNQDDAPLAQCNRFSFPALTTGQPCDLVVEVRNLQRAGKPTGELNLERIDIRLVDVNATQPAIIDGRTAGFSVRNLDGSELSVDVSQPFIVPSPSGATSPGTRRFKLRCDSSAGGLWNGGQGTQIGGMPVEGTGVRLYSDDPDNQPAKTIGLTALVSAPTINVTPDRLDFGQVEQGTTAMRSVEVKNAGNTDLLVSDVRFNTDTTGRQLSYTTSRGNPPIMLTPNETFTIQVSFTPVTAGLITDALVIGSNDVAHNPFSVPISGGAVPRVEFDPSDTLVFALPNPRPPPPIPERCLPLTIRNVGYGDLTVQRFDISGPGGDPAHPSVDDFRIQECASGLPCTPSPAIVLCPPTRPGCTTPSTNITVCYLNNDNSTTDLAELKVDTTDPTDPNHTIVLSAEDVPCFFPSPVITVETAAPTEGQEVCVNANASDPGGVPAAGATIISYEWSWVFSRSVPPPAFTPNDQARVCFTPTTAGVHILNLHVTNSCGSRSQSPGSETITVRMP